MGSTFVWNKEEERSEEHTAFNKISPPNEDLMNCNGNKSNNKKKKRWLKRITKVLLLHGKPTGTRKGKGRHHQQLLIQTWLLRNLEKKIADALPRKMDGFLYRIVIKLFELFGGKDFPFQKRFQHLCFGSKHIHPMQRRSLAMFSLETLPLKTQTWAIKRKHCLHFCFFFCK